MQVWWNGRHAWLRTKCHRRGGSSPSTCTTTIKVVIVFKFEKEVPKHKKKKKKTVTKAKHRHEYKTKIKGVHCFGREVKRYWVFLTNECVICGKEKDDTAFMDEKEFKEFKSTLE
jgi:hypothetical protein